MRPTDGQMQKADRVKDRMLDTVECIPHRLHSQLGCTGPVGVAAHAIDGDQQDRLLVRHDHNAVLVLFPITDQAQICILDSQGDLTRKSPMCIKKRGCGTTMHRGA